MFDKNDIWLFRYENLNMLIKIFQQSAQLCDKQPFRGPLGAAHPCMSVATSKQITPWNTQN